MNKVKHSFHSKTLLNKTTVQLLSCGRSEKIRKLCACKDFDTLHSTEREMLKIVTLLNKFWFRACNLASIFKLYYFPKQVTTRTVKVFGYSLLLTDVTGPSQNY